MSSKEDTKRLRNIDESSGSKGVTRRRFLGAAAGSSVAFAMTGLMTGCSGAETPAPTAVADAEAVASGEHPFVLYDADVVVVGGGLSGMFAARKAIADGASVVLVDKGPFGHSGSSGINWGHDIETNEWSEDDGSSTLVPMVVINEGVVDQDYVLSLCQNVHEAKPCASVVSVGAIVERDENGEPTGKNAKAPMVVDHGCFPRMFAQHARRSGAKILERTMVVDVLLADDGSAAGVIGIDLVNGDAVVVRAKSTVMATGNYAWCHGWVGNGPASIAGLENTGEGHSIFLGLGAEMMFMEQLPASCYQVYPDGIAYGMGSLGFGLGNYWAAVDKDGNRINEVMDEIGAMTGVNNRLTFKVIEDGRGSPDGGVYLDTTGMEIMNRYHKRVPGNEFRGLGYVIPDMMEVRPQFWESASRPVLSKAGESSIPGLFFAGSGEMSYSGCSFFGSTGSGHMAGKGAAARAAQMDRPKVSISKVHDVLSKCYGALEQEASNAIRSLQVYHNIQNIMMEGVSFVRDEKGLKKAIADLERIKEEEFPRMVVPMKTRRFNTDWRMAMEVPHMWNCIMGTAVAALERKETRGTHVRRDYPKMDNENWLKNIIVSVKDGQFVTEVRPIVASTISEADIRGMINSIGFE